ncbi:malate synthase G [Sediminivirga luteola]|uniref:Malate synthase G n=1 Tax=Sediminivirga luteola TaxID=1774748 RepID=A0A8J2XJN9_9MICO|nr:malate synthase G [Sediminivirga luteola]GGA08121.1 malate synthase G [Sediminivirga luteola]
MTERITVHGLQVAAALHDFTVREALPGTGVDADAFFGSLAGIIADLTPRNAELLRIRQELQERLDTYHRAHPGPIADPDGYRALLEEVGYLAPDPGPVQIDPEGIDPEVAQVAGPQLVVPLLNARFAINAANARFGSLYDALYGTDVLSRDGDLAPGREYNPRRGAAVIARGREVLDEHWPLEHGSHAQARGYRIAEGRLVVDLDEGSTGLSDPSGLAGWRGPVTGPDAVLLVHHGLHAELVIDRKGRIGADDAAGIDDILLESAVTTIMDLEDSVAAVDAEDKTLGYRNWLGLMRGTLTAEVAKGGETFTRTLAGDRHYTAPDGSPLTLPGRSLLFVRNVGHLMTTDAVLDAQGNEVPEGILDAMFTTLGALHDLRNPAGPRNSRSGSVYIVKPKMHGPAEVAFTVELFRRVEDALGLPEGTLKIGIMDEERRTSVNLRACIAEAAGRVAFINTGFLDRTGDEIHTAMHAGPFKPKAQLKSARFMLDYEDRNVDAGLASGFAGRAQIGKGMWAMPDRMAEMLQAKRAHPEAGASTAWVPSPTAATLHALHYHEVDVAARQRELAGREPLGLDGLLTPPLAEPGELEEIDIEREIDLNVQSILGYVVRWIDQGVGCSKVPDIHDVALMEDRATLRISSQLLANWLLHGVITAEQVEASLRRLAPVVDRQNDGDPEYRPLLSGEESGSGEEDVAFRTARDLILLGAQQPSGYTEPLLHARRRERKLLAVG